MVCALTANDANAAGFVVVAFQRFAANAVKDAALRDSASLDLNFVGVSKEG